MKKPTLKQYRDAAKHLYECEGETEFDDKPTVSKSTDGGAYVQAWVWIYDDEALKGEIDR